MLIRKHIPYRLRTLTLILGSLFFLNLPAYGLESESEKPDQGPRIVCEHCGKPIYAKYVRSDNRFFHPHCFKCDRCDQVIATAYKADGNRFFHAACFKEMKGLVCDHCGQLLDETWTVYQGKKYHPECFKKGVQPRCALCGMTISGDYTEDAEGRYHMACYKARKLPRCSVCDHPIEGNYIQDVWGHISHDSHKGKHYTLCSSCSIIISDKTSKGSFEYSDGRVICGICRESAVFHMAVAEELLMEVTQILLAKGLSPLPAGITVSLVDLKTLMNKAGTLRKSTKGLTKISTNTIGSFKLYSRTDIYILHGLPRTEFRGVLAHELLHVLLDAWGVFMSEEETEGFCNLGSRLVYQNDPSSLAKILLDNLEIDPDPVYGEGYRRMLKKLTANGWENLLIEVRNQ